jgi:hypothetical protein
VPAAQAPLCRCSPLVRRRLLPAAGLGDKERSRLRRQARDWLKGDLQAWHRLLEKEPGKARRVVVQRMQHRLADPDFNGVRGADALAKLPESERQAWQALWSEVEALRARASVNDSRPEKPTKDK